MAPPADPADFASSTLPVGNFRSLKEATPVEFKKAVEVFNTMATPDHMAERALNLFRLQKGCLIGNLVDMYTHGLQSATRAFRDGADEETCVVALLHDIGEVMTPVNHGEVAGALLRPYITPQNYWTLMHHEIFQAAYYQDAAGLTEKDTRERFKDSPYYQGCVEFCEKYDQPSFDPDYECLPLEHFVPMVKRLFARKPYWHEDHNKDKMNAAKMTIQDAYPCGSDEPEAKRQKTTTEEAPAQAPLTP